MQKRGGIWRRAHLDVQGLPWCLTERMTYVTLDMGQACYGLLAQLRRRLPMQPLSAAFHRVSTTDERSAVADQL